jgi:hypothetical protein
MKVGDLVRKDLPRSGSGLGIIIQTTKRPTKGGFDIRVLWTAHPRSSWRDRTWESRLHLEKIYESR